MANLLGHVEVGPLRFDYNQHTAIMVVSTAEKEVARAYLPGVDDWIAFAHASHPAHRDDAFNPTVREYVARALEQGWGQKDEMGRYADRGLAVAMTNLEQAAFWLIFHDTHGGEQAILDGLRGI